MKTPEDGWLAGNAYEAYMGRWSRKLAKKFVEWLRPERSAHWLDFGCGTGALTSAICDGCEPASIVGCDPAEAFVQHARQNFGDHRASFIVAGADSLPRREGGFDAIVSGLVLNFLPDAETAMASFRDRLRRGGLVAAYVWDYAEGMEFLRRFWDEAAALDPHASALDEGRRFELCRREALRALFVAAGLAEVQIESVEIATDFSDFEDYWTPFLRGTGPAPSYVASLAPESRESLRERLRRHLRPAADGRIVLRARAWAARGVSMA